MRLVRALIFLAATLLAAGTLAASLDPAFVGTLNAKFPATVGAKVEAAFPGFVSVSKGSEVFFVRDDLSVLIPGDVIDLKTNQSLSEAIRTANRPKVTPSEFDTADAIQFGTGHRRLYVFSDPDCPYCRRLQAELKKLKDVQVFLFPYPLTGLHPNSASTAESIWCQKDRAAAWDTYMATNIAPTPSHCANPIEKNVALGARLQIMATPSLVFDDGSVVPGAISVDRIEAQLAASQNTVARK